MKAGCQSLDEFHSSRIEVVKPSGDNVQNIVKLIPVTLSPSLNGCMQYNCAVQKHCHCLTVPLRH